jgi:hypothetical protein
MREYLINYHPPALPKANPRLILEQILKSYLIDFWRHQVEKDGGEVRLWDEITNNTFTTNGSSQSWWSSASPEPERVLQDGEIEDNPNSNTTSTSPSAVAAATGKTRWQYFAEQLFCLLLRMNNGSFNASQHMEPLLKICNTHKDEELTTIVGNYVSTL